MKTKYKHYIIISLYVALVVLVMTRFSYYFGSSTDWFNQHTVFPEYFRQIFYKTGKLIPNLAINYGGGQNIFNLSYYGLFNPIIIFSYLLPFINMTTYVIISHILIVIVSTIIFYNWLEENSYSSKVCFISSLIFVSSAPLIFQAHRHIMFMNYMPFLMMSLIGVDKFLKQNKKKLLIISVFLLIMTSYYYSVCGLLVIGIYYIHKYLKDNTFVLKVFLKDLIKFIFYILVSIFMAGFFLLPTLYTILYGRSASDSGINMFSLLIPNINIHKTFCGTYAIGTSVIGFIALLYMFYTKKKENITVASLTCLVLFIPIFKFLLNGGLYLREKCFIPFLPLIVYFISHFINDILFGFVDNKKFVKFLLVILIPIFVFGSKNYCLFFAFILCLILYFGKKYTNKIICLIILVVSLITGIVVNLYEKNISYRYYSDVFNNNIEKEINNQLYSDESVYRTVNFIYPTEIVNKIYNERYLTTSLYSSGYNKYYLNFVRNVFNTSNVDYNMFLVSPQKDFLFNTFMGVKYAISSNDIGLGYTKISDNMYVNNYAMPMFFTTNHILSEEEFDSYDYPYKQELLLKNVVVGNESKNKIDEVSSEKINLKYDVIRTTGVEQIKNGDSYELVVEDKGNINLKLKSPLKNKILYIVVDGLKENSCSYDNISMKINNVENILTCDTWIYANYNNTFRFAISDNYITNLNIELSKGTYNIDSLDFYILDFENIKDVRKNVDEMNIILFEQDNIVGEVYSQVDSYLVTTMPYDDGFEVKIDGKLVNIEMVNKAFLGVKVPSGKHVVEIKYSSPLLREGIILSFFGLALYGVIVISDLKSKRIH